MSLGYILLRPDFSQGAGFLFGDEAANLFVADALNHGQRLYADIAYQYGPVPILSYARLSRVIGNTPLVYLGTLAVLAAISAGVAAQAIHRSAGTTATAALLLVGLLPTMPLPGPPIGGYTSSIYFPLERLTLLTAVLLWRAPSRRRWWRSIAIGVVLGFSQGIRFGTGAVMIAAIGIADVISTSRSSRRSAAAATAITLAGFAAAELIWIVWSALLLPGPIAKEFLWPQQMWEAFQGARVARWPGWAGWRMALTQGVMPLTAAALGLWGVIRWWRAPSRNDHADLYGAPAIALLFFTIGALVFFRTEFHFRQFAWLLVLAAAPAAARLKPGIAAALVVLGCPALWPIASAFLHKPSSDIVELRVPRGYRLFVGRDIATRVQDLEPYAHDGPVLFLPNGEGWLYAFGVPHVTRHAWFYSSALVRPFEERQFVDEAARAAVLIDCDRAGAGERFRPAIAAALTQRFRPVASAGDCTISKPSAGAP